jgi:hypothetical protein
MNWNTTTYIADLSAEQKQKYADQDSACEHVEVDINAATYILRENDSFGVVGSCAVCEACKNKAKEEEDNEEHVCHDCKQTKPQKDGIHWKWYDFYPAQGDTPLFICNCCKTQPTHLARVERDRRAYEEEFGHDEDNNDQNDDSRFDDSYDNPDDGWDGEANQETDTPPEEPKVSSIPGWPFPIRG